MIKLADLCAYSLVAVALSTSAFAQPIVDLGKQEFDAKCAICHGTSAKGAGTFGELLRRSPPDLTLLAKQNQGVFPMARLYEVVEGSAVPAHGTREMPIWGKEFRAQDAQYYLEARGHYDSAALVRARILLLLEYINRLQVR
jgi:mono/diheme cytochrome c family protein